MSRFLESPLETVVEALTPPVRRVFLTESWSEKKKVEAIVVGSPILRWLSEFFDYDGAAACYEARFALLDFEELQKLSMWRIAVLARYGRQSMLQWGDVPVPTIKRYLYELLDLIKSESELSRANEDG